MPVNDMPAHSPGSQAGTASTFSAMEAEGAVEEVLMADACREVPFRRYKRSPVHLQLHQLPRYVPGRCMTGWAAMVDGGCKDRQKAMQQQQGVLEPQHMLVIVQMSALSIQLVSWCVGDALHPLPVLVLAG
jgi:hypothetical protein